MKLTKADIPMCPECGRPVKPRTTKTYWCGPCGFETFKPDLGYYAPDVAGVVAEMREHVADAQSIPSAKAIARVIKLAELSDWADRLEGTAKGS